MDSDAWSAQAEELVALASIFEQDFRLRNIGSADSPEVSQDGDDSDDDTHSQQLDHDFDPLSILEAGPPPHPAPFELEVVVHVDMPADGLPVMISTMQDPSQLDSWQHYQHSSAGTSSSRAAAGASSTSAADSSLMPSGYTIQHLSPIVMRVDMTPGYPAADPPVVQLHAMWLRPRHVKLLTDALMALWQETGPSMICFTWADWLRSDSLKALGVEASGHLVLGPQQEDIEFEMQQQADQSNGAGSAGLTRQFSVSYSIPPEQLAVSLVRYSRNRTVDLFQNQSCTCPVCYEDMLGAKCVRLPDCGHFSCHNCFTQYCNTQVSDGQVESIRCLEPSCRAPVPVSVIRSVLTEEQFQRWETLLLQKTLDRMQDICYCPRCNSATVEDGDHCARCPKCFYVFCGLCDDAWHPGTQCLDPHEAYQRKMERAQNSGNITEDERQRRHKDLMRQYQSVAMVLATSKQCPACKMAIQKSEGCNKMKCSNCGIYFCYRCLKEIDDYSHFGEGRCDLFEQEEIDRWNRMQHGERFIQMAAVNYMAREARAGRVDGVRLSPCVTCGQLNLKEGRLNLLRCQACNSYYCYLCRAHLRQKPGSHFGPSKCKQHSDD